MPIVYLCKALDIIDGDWFGRNKDKGWITLVSRSAHQPGEPPGATEDAEEEPIVEDYIIPTQSVIDIINKEGIGMGFIMQSTRGTLKQAVKSSFNTVVGMGL